MSCAFCRGPVNAEGMCLKTCVVAVDSVSAYPFKLTSPEAKLQSNAAFGPLEATLKTEQQKTEAAVREQRTMPHPDCDLCGKPLPSGAAYRRVEIVMDAADSIVGGTPEMVEHAYACCFCSDCAQSVIGGILGTIEGPSSESDSEEVLLDFSEIVREILAHDPPVTAPAVEPTEDEGCCQCGQKQTPSVGGVMTKVTWRCSQCRRLGCPNCAQCRSGSFALLEYFEATLCSRACWRAAGCPTT